MASVRLGAPTSRLPLPVVAVADGTVVGENLLARRQIGSSARPAGRRSNARSRRRSRYPSRFIMPSRPNAGMLPAASCHRRRVHHGGWCDDIVELAAPQPFVVVEIGIALGAAAAGAMASRAILVEDRPPPARGRRRAIVGSVTICSIATRSANLSAIGPRSRRAPRDRSTTALRDCQPNTPCV